MKLSTPYYLIDESKLLRNLKRVDYIRKHSCAKVLLALKCFASWSVFPLMREYMDGTTSSSLYEARLGFEGFGKETHAYCVGYSDKDIKEIVRYSDKVIFNSTSQLRRHLPQVVNKTVGLRINPGISTSHFDLADPARKFSRLGVADVEDISEVLPFISGAMFHFNCENENLGSLKVSLEYISEKYRDILKELSWVSLGGGIFFALKDYPYKELCQVLKDFSKEHNVQIYLEPGESAIHDAGTLHTSVVDIIHNEISIAIVDSSTEAHMLDLLTYHTPAEVKSSGKYFYQIAGRSCLAGDIFGEYYFKKPLRIGDEIQIENAAGYSIVKKNWFNGLQMPSIVVKRLNGDLETVKYFTYQHFKNNLS